MKLTAEMLTKVRWFFRNVECSEASKAYSIAEKMVTKCKTNEALYVRLTLSLCKLQFLGWLRKALGLEKE